MFKSSYKAINKAMNKIISNLQLNMQKLNHGTGKINDLKVSHTNNRDY